MNEKTLHTVNQATLTSLGSWLGIVLENSVSRLILYLRFHKKKSLAEEMSEREKNQTSVNKEFTLRETFCFNPAGKITIPKVLISVRGLWVRWHDSFCCHVVFMKWPHYHSFIQNQNRVKTPKILRWSAFLPKVYCPTNLTHCSTPLLTNKTFKNKSSKAINWLKLTAFTRDIRRGWRCYGNRTCLYLKLSTFHHYIKVYHNKKVTHIAGKDTIQ